MIIVCLLLTVGAAPAQPPQFKIENPQMGHPTGAMGQSVSVDGDTMIVGAPHTAPLGLSNAGVARIYHRDDLGGWTIQAEIIASDAAEGDLLGESVAISGDTVVVGARGDETGMDQFGSAYIFTRSGNIWTQQQKLTGSGAAEYNQFGYSVSISGDTIVVGVLGDNDGGILSGAAYIFTRSGTTWTQQQKITATDAAELDYFGYSVSISDDTVLVGASQNDDGDILSGSAYIFTRSGTTWTQQQKLTAPDAAEYDFFGSSVSILGDTAVVGAIGDDDGGIHSGSACIFTRSGTTWTQQQKLTASDAAEYGSFGYSVSISDDTIVVGALCDDDGGVNSGSTYIFTRSGTTWTQQQKIIAADVAANDYFGHSVSISGDAVIVGSPGNDDGGSAFGSAYVFTRSGSTWSQQANLNSIQSASEDFFGHSVSISGNTAIVVGYGNSAYVFMRSGTTWLQQQKLPVTGISVSISGDTAMVGTSIFTRSGTTWALQQKLIDPAGSAQSNFGYSVSISGDTAIVGAPGMNSNTAHIFTRSGTTWTHQEQLTYRNPERADLFGWSVSISGDTVIVGAPGKTSGGSFGEVYVFSRDGGTWLRKYGGLVAEDARALNFGWSVSISDDTFVVGAPEGPYGGAAFTFMPESSGGLRRYKLVSSLQSFGKSVSISGDMLVVGAYRDDEGGSDSGSAYVFTRQQGMIWSGRNRLTAYDTASGDGFGHSVSVDFGQVICGAPYNDDPAINEGSAYVYRFAPDAEPTTPMILAEQLNSLMFGWSGNSSDEDGFHVYSDPGVTKPTTLIDTTLPNITFSLLSGIGPNEQHSFSASAFNAFSETIPTATVTGWTLIEPVAGLVFSEISVDKINVAPVNTISNLTEADSGLFFTNTTAATDCGTWRQTMAAWESDGLLPNRQYTFTGKSRNGDNIETTMASDAAWTLAATPIEPIVSDPQVNSLDISVDQRDGNPSYTGYAIKISPKVDDKEWVQGDGVIGTAPVFLISKTWTAKTVLGLAESATYTFTVRARNEVGMKTLYSPAAVGRTKREPTPGDVTGDHILSLPDANLLKEHLLERAPLTGDALARADANKDGVVNLADFVWIINKITTTGTVSIDVTPDSGSWTLTGPSGFSTLTGTGDRVGGLAVTIAPPGQYSLICDDNVWKHNPPMIETKTLLAGEMIEFTPIYGTTILLPGEIPLEMVPIPAGSFLRGRYPGEQDSTIFEDPQRRVTFWHAFEMSKYEVTQAQWESLMGTSPWLGGDYVLDDPQSPATYVSWRAAKSFIERLNNHYTRTDTFRPPSESEWEYSCRAGTTTRFYWGDDLSYTEIGKYAWYRGNTLDEGERYAHVVGQKLPNAWGLYDMSGNVSEWCEDSWYEDYTISPWDGSPLVIPTSDERVVRGGRWGLFSSIPYDCRSAGRGRQRESGANGTSPAYTGFRIVRAGD